MATLTLRQHDQKCTARTAILFIPHRFGQVPPGHSDGALAVPTVPSLKLVMVVEGVGVVLMIGSGNLIGRSG